MPNSQCEKFTRTYEAMFNSSLIVLNSKTALYIIGFIVRSFEDFGSLQRGYLRDRFERFSSRLFQESTRE